MGTHAEKIKDHLDDLKIPAGVRGPAREFAKKLLNYAAALEFNYTGGCKLFYSGAEWRERGEAWGNNAVMVICHDGGDFWEILNYDSNFNARKYTGVNAVSKIADECGVWTEALTGWATAVYIED